VVLSNDGPLLRPPSCTKGTINHQCRRALSSKRASPNLSAPHSGRRFLSSPTCAAGASSGLRSSSPSSRVPRGLPKLQQSLPPEPGRAPRSVVWHLRQVLLHRSHPVSLHGCRRPPEHFRGREPLENAQLENQFVTLLGLTPETRPFECVGDVGECRAALHLAASRADRNRPRCSNHCAPPSTPHRAPGSPDD